MKNSEHIHFIGVNPPERKASAKALPAGMIARASTSLRVPPGTSGTEPMDPFASWLLEKAGVNPQAYRAAAVQRRIPACLRQLRVNSGDAAKDLLRRKPEILPRALNTILIGVTEFFRDEAVFDFLRATGLPELLRNRSRLRVYSAGASDGQELYSVGMLLAEAGRLKDSFLMGVDCRPAAIMRATLGRFEKREVEGIARWLFEACFQPEGDAYVICPEIRRQTHWRLDNLFSFQDSEPWDLILFRNVAIYFDEFHAEAAWNRLCGQLAPGGLLVTGKAEKPPAKLPLERIAPCVFRKKEM